ncbi:DUF4129 domain-containing protein [Deinococcus fonticola]|uniref:DUF4129 domain-containing protein n=1 Tax=Deinococcus fonticola TaxID=2528713 RepID=UPI00107578EE|nr:DUF4129 domain-containing protein [Deinococcus fonticola]
MTFSPSSGPSPGRPPDRAQRDWLRDWLGALRRFGVAALPLALAGILPWWALLLLCLVFGASAASERGGEARLLLGLLVVGAAVLPEVLRILSAGTGALDLYRQVRWEYLLALLNVALLHWAANMLAGGSRKGLLLTAGVALMAPHPLSVVALAGGALFRESPDDRPLYREPEGPAAETNHRLYGAWLVAGLVAVLGFSFLLPRGNGGATQAPVAQSSPLPQQPPVKREEPTQGAAAEATGGKAGGVAYTLEKSRGFSMPPLELPLLLGALLLLALGYRLLGLRGGQRRKPTLLELLMAAAILLNVALFFIFSSSPDAGVPAVDGASGGDLGSALKLRKEAFEQIRSVPMVMDAVSLFFWIVLAIQAVVVVLAVRWALRQPQEKNLELEPQEATADSMPVPADALSGHRVRLAYRSALEALTQHGWARLGSETPARYAARVSAAQAAFAPALGLLTALYQPVRYGGRVSEHDAAQAEQAARELTDLAARYPFNEPNEPQEQNLSQELT